MCDTANIYSLDEITPENGESVFVYDSCWGEWAYAEYRGLRNGKHMFFEGHNSYGEEFYAERPTHFWRVELPKAP